MYINQSSKFDDKKGDFIILNDYGSEGLAVKGQYKSAEEAIKNLGADGGCPQTIVRLIDFEISIID